jgi:peptide/nickel transport system ATP-binding protein
MTRHTPPSHPACHESAPILEAADVEVEYATSEGAVRSLDGATLRVEAGQITAVVGESGSGKTTLGMAAGRLLASNAVYAGGTLTVAGVDVFDCDRAALAALRRNVLGFVFQNPIAALDPTMRIGKQMALAAPDNASRESITRALEDVHLPEVPRVLRSYPHQLSGGMAQRVSVAMALRRSPRLLIADEPTASVDATHRGQILTMLVERCRAQECCLLLLTHDLHAVATHTTHIAVMYGGRVVESGVTGDVLSQPQHPYTRALLTALPGEEQLGQRLEAIPGVPPVLRAPSLGCAFTDRCPVAMEKCRTIRPKFEAVAEFAGRKACCHLVSGTTEGDATPIDRSVHATASGIGATGRVNPLASHGTNAHELSSVHAADAELPRDRTWL